MVGHISYLNSEESLEFLWCVSGAALDKIFSTFSFVNEASIQFFFNHCLDCKLVHSGDCHFGLILLTFICSRCAVTLLKDCLHLSASLSVFPLE